MGIDEIRPHGDRVMIGIDRLRQVSLCGAKQAEAITRDRMPVGGVQDHPIKLFRFHHPTRMMMPNGLEEGCFDIFRCR